MSASATPLLDVRDLSVTLHRTLTTRRPAIEHRLLDAVAFAIAAGESVGVVGPSGAGKSSLGSALLRLLPPGASVEPTASVRLNGTELLALNDAAMRQRRGREIALIFQEPLLALNPAMRVGAQLAESLTVHGLATTAEARERAIAMLAKVGISDPRHAAERFPHEFSGGMRQRLLIATALLPGPSLIIADEPTTALDPTIQAQVLDLLDALRAETGAALLHISHDLDVIGERCSRVLVMDKGRIVEEGEAQALIRTPRSAQARALVAARLSHSSPRRGASTTTTASGATAAMPATETTSLLTGDRISVTYEDRRRRGGVLTAVREVSLTIGRGEVVAVVGESGCGKSSLAHAILRLADASGTISLDGASLGELQGEALRRIRRRVQWVPQDAGAALTPHLTARTLVAEGLIVHGLAAGAAASARAGELLGEVGLGAELHDRLPSELSAGERQRVTIARALSTSPDLLICDEPVASVYAPNRALLLDLFDRLRRDRALSMLFISHDLAAVRRIADRVLVMYLGRLVEAGTVDEVLSAPLMPYTTALLAAVPTGDPAARRARVLPLGEPPSALVPPPGCPFHPRCPSQLKDEACRGSLPPLVERLPGRQVACLKA
jgi:peptide/nickel transport system ATP-binding protein